MTRPDIERLITRVDSGLSVAELKPYAEALRWCLAEMDAMRPIIDVMVRIAELDELCEAHPSNSDPAGNAAEVELYDRVKEKTRLVEAYRARETK